MPELPDVEHFRQYMEHSALHKRVASVAVENDYVVGGRRAAARLRKSLPGRSLEDTCRHGKNLFVELDNGEFIRFHFGMTGDVQVYQDASDEPRFTRVRLDFADGDHLAYADMRMLGSIELIDDAERFVSETHLGPDAAAISSRRFEEIMSSKRGKVKTALMDQTAIAGIGNIYSDEILFQSGIHPNKNIEDLDDKAIQQLYKNTRKVLSTAIDRDARPEEFPRTYLIPRRKSGQKCPRCKTDIRSVKVNGRTAWYCPRCQKA